MFVFSGLSLYIRVIVQNNVFKLLYSGMLLLSDLFRYKDKDMLYFCFVISDRRTIPKNYRSPYGLRQ